MNDNDPIRIDTKRRILDASEYFFARDGYRGTSLRAITGRAGVNLAAVNYHFGSKKVLVEEVIKRRLLPLNNVRKKRLEEVREAAVKKGKQPDIRAVLEAFFEPTLSFKEASPEAGHFFSFIGRSMSDPDNTVRNVFIRYMKPLFHLMLDISCEALPEQPRELIFWRLHFAIGSLFHTMHMCSHVKSEFKDVKTDINARSLLDLIIPYVTAGMKAK